MFMFLYGNLSFGIKTGFKIIKLHAVNHQLNSGSINFNHNWLRDILYNCELTDPVGIMSSVLGTR